MKEQDLHKSYSQQWVRCQPRVYAYIRTIVFNRMDAEDVLQEVAELLWQKFDQFEPGSRFDQWAFAVARNKMLNFQKKKSRERVKFSDAFENVLASEAAELDDQSELIDVLESCVEKLPSAQRDVLDKRYQPGETNRSVARSLGRSESAISRTLNKVYQQLLVCIEERMGAVHEPESK